MTKSKQRIFRRQLRKIAIRRTNGAMEARQVLSDDDLFEIAFEGFLIEQGFQDVGSNFLESLKDFLDFLIQNQEGLIEFIKSIVNLFNSQNENV